MYKPFKVKNFVRKISSKSTFIVLILLLLLPVSYVGKKRGLKIQKVLTVVSWKYVL